MANEMVVRLRDMHPIVIRAQVRRPLSSRDISPPSRALAAHATPTKGLSAALWILEAGEKHVAGAVVAAGSRAFPNANTRRRPRRRAAPVPRPDDVASPPVHGAVGSDATARQVRRLGSAVPTVPLGLASAAALASPRPLAACSSAQLGSPKQWQNACWSTKST